MRAGITETDVWNAADALLLQGARPTIERVRQQIGRGSPNTVSPHLDTWFRHLGARIQDPGAFSAAPAWPDPVQQIAAQFWETALTTARGEAAVLVEASLASAQAAVAAERDKASAAAQDAVQARARASVLTAALAASEAALADERQAHAVTGARRDDARASLAGLQATLAQAAAQSAEQLRPAQSQALAADDRASATERRVALELDRERMARIKSDKRASVLETTLDAERRAAAVHREAQAGALAELGARAEQLARELRTQESERSALADSLAATEVDASRQRREAELARGEAAAMRLAVEQLGRQGPGAGSISARAAARRRLVRRP